MSPQASSSKGKFSQSVNNRRNIDHRVAASIRNVRKCLVVLVVDNRESTTHACSQYILAFPYTMILRLRYILYNGFRRCQYRR